MTPDGTVERGLREIAPVQAAIVIRIFREFAGGHSPIAIARRLNAEGVPGPRGKLWSDGTIRGFGRTSTGILRNTIYIGEVVWNRRRWIKDPTTGRRVARRNDAGQLLTPARPSARHLAATRDQHRQILEAVRQGDEAVARDRLREHLKESVERFRKKLGERL
jgi:hypothetical protein